MSQTLREKLTNDMKDAMRAKEKQRLQTIRMILSDVKYAEMDKSPTEDDNEMVLKVIQNYTKKLKKSLSDYPDGDKKNEILEEIKLCEEYLPRQLSDGEIKEKLKEVLNAQTSRDFGTLMKLASISLKGQAEGGAISKNLKELLMLE